MRLLVFICLAFIAKGTLLASTITGTVVDEKNDPIAGATVVLLETLDSSIVSFALSDESGQFDLTELDKGDYLLQVSFVSYRTISIPLMISEEVKALGIIRMEFISEVLQEVTVKAEHIPMGIIGDTISYNAAAFKTRPGASVEDLLKKLPGIEVSRDGSIKAMGEDVENVLVEGKEFFGDDPQIATKNLEAEAVDKVQVFDRKSEIAEFTGIDDGEDEKTINLELKEGHKSGGFGKVNAEGGTDSRYYNKLNYNRFSPTLQTSIIANVNNVNEQAFTFNEYIQFMGGLGNAMSNMNSTFQFSEFSGGMAPQGITENISTGLNFNYDFSSKLTLNSHYFLVDTDLDRHTESKTTQFTESSEFTTLDDVQRNRGSQLHRLNTKLKWKPNPFTQLLIKNNLQGNWNDLVIDGITDYYNMNMFSGQTLESNQSNDRQLGYEGYLQLRQKFLKEGRNLISTIQYQAGSHIEAIRLMNVSDLNNFEAINQWQDYTFEKDIVEFGSAYTEPLGRKWYLGLSFKMNREQENPDKLFYDFADEELIPNELLSTTYRKTENQYAPRLSIKKNSSKLTSDFGIGMQWTNIKGMSEGFSDDIINNSFYLLPSARFNLDVSSSISLTLDYDTRIEAPSLEQLAPIPDNSNPNLFRKGNPNLEPEYHHVLNFFFRSLDQFSFKNLIWNTNVIFFRNRIVDEVIVNEDFTQTFRPVNTDRFLRINSRLSYSSPLRALKLKYHTSLSYANSSYTSFLNGTASDVNENRLNYNFTLENRNKDQFDIATGFTLALTNRSYAINSDFNQRFSNYSIYTDAYWFINDEWKLGTRIDYQTFSEEFFSEAQSFILWNASLSKSFKDDLYGVEFKVYDILKQNRGISRSGGLNSLYEVQYNTLTQYFSIGVHYKLGKSKRNSINAEFN